VAKVGARASEVIKRGRYRALSGVPVPFFEALRLRRLEAQFLPRRKKSTCPITGSAGVIHVATMTATHDVFFSYRRQDLTIAQPFLAALAEAGVRLWRDETDLPDYAPITPEIRVAIASSKVLLALHSATYLLSSACQQELTTAWIAAQQMNAPPYSRVLILNPEPGFDHIPKALAEQQSMRWPADSVGFAVLARKVRAHVDSLSGTLASAEPWRLPTFYGMAPVQAERFIGRVRELWDLHSRLTGNRMSVITGTVGQAVARLEGLAGSGKSLLAREYAIRFGPAYPGGVFWLNAYGNDDTKGRLDATARESLRQDQIRAFAIRTGVEVEGQSPQEIEAAFWRKLEAVGRAGLWIVDDLPSGLASNELEGFWTAQGSAFATLVTTRSMEYRSFGKSLELDMLPEENALELLTARRRPADGAQWDAAREIVRALGCHPLAIDVAGGFLALFTETFKGYLAALADPCQDAVEFGAELHECLPTGHERSISSTLWRSIALLGPDGLDFLRLASVLAVAPIPAKLVSGVFEKANVRVGAAIDQVASLGLCRTSGDEAWSVHALVNRTVSRYCGPVKRIEELRRAVTQTLAEALMVVSDIRRHSEVTMDLVHARHVVSSDLGTSDEVNLAAWIAEHDRVRGDYAGARILGEKVLEASIRVCGADHRDTAMAMNNLAITRDKQGDLTGARALQEQALAACRRLLGPEHPDTLSAMSNLGNTLEAQGDLAGARALHEHVLHASLRLFGTDDLNTLTAMNHLAHIMGELGELASARALEEQAVEAMVRLYGAEDRHTLWARAHLASTMHEQGDVTGARALQEQVMEAYGRLSGPEHPDTLSAMANLAGTMHEQGDLTGARALQEQALAACRRLLGPEHPNTLSVMSSLAATMLDQGDLMGARALQEQMLDASLRVCGIEHPKTLSAMNNLAHTMRELGDLMGARGLQEQVLEAYNRLLGVDHPETLTAMNNLARTIEHQGDLTRARELGQKVLEASVRVCGAEHPDTLSAMANLAGTMHEQGDLTGARALQQQVLEARGRLLGPEHPDTLTAMNNLALTMRAQGDLAGARRLWEQVLAARRRLLGVEHPGTTRVAWNLFCTLQDLGQAHAAVDLLDRDLGWLFIRAPVSLSADQRRIREWITIWRDGLSALNES